MSDIMNFTLRKEGTYNDYIANKNTYKDVLYVATDVDKTFFNDNELISTKKKCDIIIDDIYVSKYGNFNIWNDFANANVNCNYCVDFCVKGELYDDTYDINDLIINIDIKSSSYFGFITEKNISCDDNKFTIKYKAYVKQKHFQMNWKIYATVIIDGTYNCNQSEFTTIRETIKDRPFNNFNIVKGNMPFDAKPYYIYTGNKIKYKLKWNEHDSTIIQFDNKYNDFLDNNDLSYIGYFDENGQYINEKNIFLKKINGDNWGIQFNTKIYRDVLLFMCDNCNYNFIYKNNYNQIRCFKHLTNNGYLIKEIVADTFKKTDTSTPLTFHKGYMPIYARPYHVYNSGIKIPIKAEWIEDINKSIFNLDKYSCVIKNLNYNIGKYLGCGDYELMSCNLHNHYNSNDEYDYILCIHIDSPIYKNSKGHIVEYKDIDNYKHQTEKKIINDDTFTRILKSNRLYIDYKNKLCNHTGYGLEIQYYRLNTYRNEKYNKKVYKFPLRKYHKFSHSSKRVINKIIPKDYEIDVYNLRYYKNGKSCQKYRIRINTPTYISNWVYIMIFNNKIYYLN